MTQAGAAGEVHAQARGRRAWVASMQPTLMVMHGKSDGASGAAAAA